MEKKKLTFYLRAAAELGWGGWYTAGGLVLKYFVGGCSSYTLYIWWHIYKHKPRTLTYYTRTHTYTSRFTMNWKSIFSLLNVFFFLFFLFYFLFFFFLLLFTNTKTRNGKKFTFVLHTNFYFFYFYEIFYECNF